MSKEVTTRIWIDGERATLRARNKTELARQVAMLKESARAKRLGLPDPHHRREDVTYDQLCDKVLGQYPHSEQSKATLRFNLKRSRDTFGDVLVRELLPESIGAWLAKVDGAVTTKRSSLKAMRQALHRAVAWEYVAENAAAKVEMPPEPTYIAHPFDSWEQVRHVAQQFKLAYHRALVIFACATGLRPQEWRALPWDDIDVPNRCLRINWTIRNGKRVQNEAKTHGSLRTVLLRAEALEALAMLPTPIDTKALVFPGVRGDVLDAAAWRRGPWTKALTAAGVEYREPYGMRDTYACLMLEDHAPLEWISEQMGHEDIKVTRDHYARWSRTTDYRIIDTVNAASAERIDHFSTTTAER